MEQNTITEAPSHKHQKLLDALSVNSINQQDPVPEWVFVKFVDLSGGRLTTKCLCSTPIAKFYKIKNKHTLKEEIIGSECIRRFMENAVECEICNKKLRNIGERLSNGNFICPSCTRMRQAKKAAEMKKYDNYKYYHTGHPYNNMKFKDIVNSDLRYMLQLIENPRTNTTPAQAKSYECLMEYVDYHCAIV